MVRLYVSNASQLFERHQTTVVIYLSNYSDGSKTARMKTKFEFTTFVRLGSLSRALLNLTGNRTASLGSLFIIDRVHLMSILSKLFVGFSCCKKNQLAYFFVFIHCL